MRALFQLLAQSYSGLPASSWLLAAAAFLNRAGSMVVPFLTIYLGERFQLDFEQAGWFGSIYGIGAVLGSLLGGRLCDRIGPVRVQILTLGGAAVWFWTLAAVDDLVLLGAGLFGLGMLNDAFRPGNFAAALASSPPTMRPKAMALNRLALNAGWMIGPAIGGLLAEHDFRWLFLVDGGSCGVAAAFLWGCRHRLRQLAPAAADAAAAPQSPWRDHRFLLLCLLSVLAMLVFLQSVVTQNRYLHEALDIPKAKVGLLAGINPLLIVVVEMPLVQALRRRDQLPIVAAGVLLVGLGLLLLACRGGGIPVVLLSILVVACGEMLWSPQLAAYLGDLAPPAARGRYMGVYTATISAALILAPWLRGTVYERCSPAALWLGCGAASLLLAIAFLLLYRRQRPPRLTA